MKTVFSIFPFLTIILLVSNVLPTVCFVAPSSRLSSTSNEVVLRRRTSSSRLYTSTFLPSTGNESLKIPGNGDAVASPKSNDLKEFEGDVKKVLKEMKAGVDTTVYPKLFACTKSDLSISSVWDLDMWRRHSSRSRYLRHMRQFFTTRLMKRIYPQLLCYIMWSTANIFLVGQKSKNGMVPLSSLSLVSTFVGFLLTLRSNQGLSRLQEARQLWGRLFIVCRDTSHLLSTYVYSKDERLGLQSVRHLTLFPWLLKGLLRGTDETDLVDVVLRNGNDATFLRSQRKRPAACVARVRRVVADAASLHGLPHAAHHQLEKNLNEMNYILGMSERIKGSPAPPIYTSHTSHLLIFYLAALPVAFQPHVTNLVNLLVTSALAFAMLGLDEISHLLEQPFQLMPLQELSRNMMLDMSDALVCRPPPSNSDEFVYPYNESNTTPEYW